jgi:hypothetical protein
MVALTKTFPSDMMTNAWSLLYDELKMTENFETNYESLLPEGYSAVPADTVPFTFNNFGKTMVLV